MKDNCSSYQTMTRIALGLKTDGFKKRQKFEVILAPEKKKSYFVLGHNNVVLKSIKFPVPASTQKLAKRLKGES